ncbi:MAG: hypothetical protein K2X86_03180 [Cytophagaceae bacterium]|nr:hypothetical protein [Cytophagaceae bacterium]
MNKSAVYLIIIFIGIISSCKTKAPAMIEECTYLDFDLKEGTMSGVKPNLPQGEIKEWFPCFTKFIPDGADAECGGALLYDNHYFSFYTYFDDYIEVRTGFKGKISDSLFLKTREEIRLAYGTPLKDSLNNITNNPDIDFYKADYGCIRIHYKDNKPVIIAVHYSDIENIWWCGQTQP